MKAHDWRHSILITSQGIEIDSWICFACKVGIVAGYMRQPGRTSDDPNYVATVRRVNSNCDLVLVAQVLHE